MRPFVHDAPATRVVFGAGSRHGVAAELDRLGVTRALLIHGGHEREHADAIAADLGPRAVGRFSDVARHVPAGTARAAAAVTAEAGADSLLAVGGGSAIGVAKAVARDTGLPIVAVPTTYAGSEMTPIWGVTDERVKTTGRDPRVLPRVVLYDPEVTLSLPPEVSAASGMNAMAHLVEALYAPDASPLIAVVAEDGIRALAAGLTGVAADPGALPARTETMYGAWLAGWCLALTTMGLHHRICHVLGGGWDLPHAPTHSALLPHVTAHQAVAAPQEMARIARGLTAAGRSAGSAAAGIWDLARDVGAPTSLADVGFPDAAVDEATRKVLDGAPAGPRPVDADGVRSILEHALLGERPGGSSPHAERASWRT